MANILIQVIKLPSLQSLDPIYVNFLVPEQQFAQIKLGHTVDVTTDSYPEHIYHGKINAINPIIDTATRNVQVEAVIPNPKIELLPGMFASVKVNAGKKNRYLTLPQTAITYNPYGDTVFVVKQSDKDKKGQPILTVRQIFVTTGGTRGDQIAVLSGIKAGDIVVTSGQLKLKNGSRVQINNKVVPSNAANPKLVEE